jgi:hypothetical protein
MRINKNSRGYVILKRWCGGGRSRFYLYSEDGTVLSGEHSCFIFERSQVKISAQRPAILSEVFCDFPQSFQANSGIVP